MAAYDKHGIGQGDTCFLSTRTAIGDSWLGKNIGLCRYRSVPARRSSSTDAMHMPSQTGGDRIAIRLYRLALRSGRMIDSFSTSTRPDPISTIGIQQKQGTLHMSERQRRNDEITANAVARGLNILAVRNAALATHYMKSKSVPAKVIKRVIRRPKLRRRESADQSVSEAITPSGPKV